MNSTAKEVKNEWTAEEKKSIPPMYGCEILLENTTVDNANDPSFPSDAYIVKYQVDNKTYIDLCRGNRVSIFDMYYDKFGSNSLKDITWAKGKINPNLWGYKAPAKSKKRKSS